jgi:hypothetical protein
LNQSRRRNQASNSFAEHHFESYLHKSSAEESIMIHEKIVSKDKQSESAASIEAELSSRSMKNNRRASIISIEIFDDESENARISYHVRNIDQLKY